MGYEVAVVGISCYAINSLFIHLANRDDHSCYKCWNRYISKVILLIVGLNVITEFIAGYMFPGRPLANMMIKAYGYMTMSQVQHQPAASDKQGLDFVADLKLGLYMKVSPRSMFRTQIWCTTLA